MRILIRTMFIACAALLLLSNFVTQAAADGTKDKAKGIGNKTAAANRRTGRQSKKFLRSAFSTRSARALFRSTPKDEAMAA